MTGTITLGVEIRLVKNYAGQNEHILLQYKVFFSEWLFVFSNIVWEQEREKHDGCMYEDCLCDLERNVNTSLFWIDVEETPNYFVNFTTKFQKDDLFTASFV